MVKVLETEFVRHGLTEEELQWMEEVKDEYLLEGQLRLDFYFGRHGIDVEMLKSPCYTKLCIRKKVEYHKEMHIDTYNRTLANTPNIPELQETAKHEFYTVLFNDLISVIEAFNSPEEIGLWYEVREEYLTQYKHFTEEFLKDPVGKIVGGAFGGIIKVGTDLLGDIVEGTARAFGIDTGVIKVIAIAGIIGLVGIGILILVSKLRRRRD